MSVRAYLEIRLLPFLRNAFHELFFSVECAKRPETVIQLVRSGLKAAH